MLSYVRVVERLCNQRETMPSKANLKKFTIKSMVFV
jgi:hypothetical protein